MWCFYNSRKSRLTNKDRLCERSEPQSYPVVGQARSISIRKYLFLNKGWEARFQEAHFCRGEGMP